MNKVPIQPENFYDIWDWSDFVASGKRAKKTICDMQLLAKKRGGKCLSVKYVKINKKLKWECSFGHIWDASYKSISQGRWCPKCAIINRKHSKKYRLIGPDGTIYVTKNGLKNFCKDHNLNIQCIYHVSTGVRNSSHGWTCERIK